MKKSKKLLSPLLFFIAFILPVSIFYVVFGMCTKEDVVKKDVKFMKNTFSVRLPGKSLRIFDDELLNPEKDKDFILTGWFKFRKLPQDGEKVILLTKYDATTAYNQGYAFAIEKKEATGYRGCIFWQDINNNGRWYTFNEIPLVTDTWFMFTISYTSNKHLALYYTYELDNEVISKLIGAYKVDAVPTSKSSFRVGSLVTQLFDGRIGTVSVIKAKNVENSLNDIISANFASPRKIPSSFKNFDISLWTVGGVNDLGKHKFNIVKVGKASDMKKESL